MVTSGKDNQEGTFPAIWPVNPLWYILNLCLQQEYSNCISNFEQNGAGHK
jgi:hypothetical protein